MCGWERVIKDSCKILEGKRVLRSYLVSGKYGDKELVWASSQVSVSYATP